MESMKDRRPPDLHFPDGFAWGVATASYQNEGAVAEGGRSPSIWDTFAHTPGKIADGTTGDVACDHYHRYRDDVALMSDLGIGYYRFSFSWSRLQPDGRGELNADGVDFYSRLIDALLERDVTPWVTLYHWDLPQVLQDAGGWPERATAERFTEYSAMVYDRFRDRVRHWTTLNEPWVAAFVGHCSGVHAPGSEDAGAALRAAHHLLLGHGLATRAMRSIGDGTSQHGITLSLQPVIAASTDAADADAARRVDLMANRMFLAPLLSGGYPADFRQHVEPLTSLDYIQDDDEATIAAPIDFLGVNYYVRHLIRQGQSSPSQKAYAGCDGAEFLDRGLRRTAVGWEIDPDGLHAVLAMVRDGYPEIPLYVTENGTAMPDTKVVDGALHDPDRIEYLDSHLRAALRAIADGIDLRGYFVWTLMDNWEWAEGFGAKFGLYHVDFDTQQRTPKDSALWFAEVTRRNGLAP